MILGSFIIVFWATSALIDNTLSTIISSFEDKCWITSGDKHECDAPVSTTIISSIILFVVLYKLKFGLRLKACGENPSPTPSKVNAKNLMSDISPKSVEKFDDLTNGNNSYATKYIVNGLKNYAGEMILENDEENSVDLHIYNLYGRWRKW